MDYLDLLIPAIYLALPAGLANMAPIMVHSFKILESLKIPIHSDWLGDHKTYRGLLVGVLTGLFVVWLQYHLYRYEFFRQISLIAYNKIHWWLFGLLAGFGALLGDIVKSFVKRRFGIAPGRPFIPFDQCDFVLGFLLMVSLYLPLSWEIWIVLLVVYPFMHLIINFMGYRLGLKEVWW